MSLGSNLFGTSTTAAPASTSLFGQGATSKPAGSFFGATQPSTSTFTGFGAQPQQQTAGATSTQPQPSTSTFTGFGAQPQQQTAGVTSTQPQPSTGLFGQQPASSATQTQGPFGQSGSTTTGTSLFGGTAQPSATTAGQLSSTPQPAQGTQPQQQAGLFGQSTTSTTAPTTTLFGQPAKTTTTTQPTSLFPQQASSTTPTAQPTSLFGQSASTTTAQPTSFGQSATNTTQPKPLFGQPANTTGSSLFGSTTQQPVQQGSNIFGNVFQTQPAAAATFSTPSSNLFGMQQSMSISPVQGTGPILFSKTTKFNDLSEDVKKRFEALDTHIQGRIQISNELKRRKLGQEPMKGRELIEETHKELLSMTSTIQTDAQFVRDLESKTEQAVQDTITATRIIDGFRNPQQNGAYLKNHASFPLEFFARVTKEMQERLQWCKNTTEQIERKLSSAAVQQQNTPQAIASTLQAQHGVFVSLAAKTAAVHAELQKLKTLYTQLWRGKTGSMRDPFNDLDRGSGGDFGMDGVESLRIK